jgi:hypothetical protein
MLFPSGPLQFSPDGTPIICPGVYGNPLTVKDSTGSMVTIPAKSVYDSHKTLGHYKAPAGINTKQRDVLHLKSNTFARLVSTSSCDQQDSWFFYQAIYIKSLGYALPTCYFEETILKKVQNAALRAFLSKCGYNRNTKRATVVSCHYT